MLTGDLLSRSDVIYDYPGRRVAILDTVPGDATGDKGRQLRSRI